MAITVGATVRLLSNGAIGVVLLVDIPPGTASVLFDPLTGLGTLLKNQSELEQDEPQMGLDDKQRNGGFR